MRWGVASSVPRTITSSVAEPCRVCGVEIPSGSEVLHVAWESGIAHPACGWKRGPGLAVAAAPPAPPSCDKCGEDVADASELTETVAGFHFCGMCMRRAAGT